MGYLLARGGVLERTSSSEGQQGQGSGWPGWQPKLGLDGWLSHEEEGVKRQATLGDKAPERDPSGRSFSSPLGLQLTGTPHALASRRASWGQDPPSCSRLSSPGTPMPPPPDCPRPRLRLRRPGGDLPQPPPAQRPFPGVQGWASPIREHEEGSGHRPRDVTTALPCQLRIGLQSHM